MRRWGTGWGPARRWTGEEGTDLQPSTSEAQSATDSFFVNLEFFFNWRTMVQSRNSGKVGKPFAYPDSLFEYLAWVRVRRGLDYRGLERFWTQVFEAAGPRLRGLGMTKEDVASLRVPHFTQIRRRASGVRLDPEVGRRLASPEACFVLLDVDAPAVLSEREWTRTVGNRVTRGWIRAPAAALGGSATSG